MKTINKLFCALFILTTIVACDLEKITNLQDTFKVVINPDAVDNKKEIIVLNSNDDSVVTDASLTITGEVASDVYTSDGYSDFEFDEGQIVIGLKQTVAPTAENSKSVSAEFSAPGYLTKTIQVTFDGTPVESTEVYLIPENALPKNVKTKAESGSTGTAIVIETETAAGGENLTTVEMPATTTFKKADGTAATGTLEVKLETFELTADGESTTGYNALDEIPELKSENGEGIVPTGIIKINPTIGGESVIPSEINIDVPQGKDLYFVLPDGTTIKLPSPTAAKKSNSSDNYNVDINALITLLKSLGFNLKDLLFIFADTHQENDMCDTKTIRFSNNGVSANFNLKISEGSSVVFQKSFTVFAGATKEVKGLTLVTSKQYTYSVTAATVNGPVNIIDPTTIDCASLANTIELSNVIPSEVLVIPFNITCSTVAIALDETILSYRKSTDTKYVIYGKIIDGELTSKSPKLDASTEYVFKFFYQKERVTDAVLGSEVKELINTYDKDEICARIEEEI